MFLRKVVYIHIDPPLVAEGVFDMAAAAPILPAGGADDYFRRWRREQVRHALRGREESPSVLTPQA
jgi:hypothetical protein